MKLGKGYSVGEKLGEGAQCSVYALLLKGKPTDYVVKTAPIPVRPQNMKAKPSVAMINANSLNIERSYYTNFLCDLQGTMISKFGVSDWHDSMRLEVDGTC